MTLFIVILVVALAIFLYATATWRGVPPDDDSDDDTVYGKVLEDDDQ